MFNAKYLAYVDDCVDVWFVDTLGSGYLDTWEMMVKRAAIEWSSPARYRDVLTCSASVSRWGRTSFDVQVTGAVGEREVFIADLVYVSVSPGTHTPVEVPASVRELLSSASASGTSSGAARS